VRRAYNIETKAYAGSWEFVFNWHLLGLIGVEQAFW
jgi:hypothetical protein